MRLTILAVMLSLMPALLTAEVTMADGRKPLSVGPNGVEAIAVSENAIDIYLPINHNGVSVTKDGIAIGNALPGVRKLRDEGLAPDTIYTYTIKSIEEPEILLAVVAEKTFTAFQPQATYGVVVVGATAAGTSAAVTAARMGVSVALVEETNRAGGMAANGLGSTDIRNISRSNGFFEEFRTRVASYYGSSHNGLRYEPRVANAIMKSMVYEEPGISFFRKTRATGVIIHGPRVAGVQVTHLDTGQIGELYGQVVIDATVEADVAAATGVQFRIPREARSPEEPHAGHIYYDNQTDEILPGSTGEADHRIQSYAYLLTVKDYGEGQDRTIPEPPNYNPEDYRYSPPWTESWAYTSGRLPNGKFEINQHPWGTDLPGINYDYPTASPERRAEIELLYRWRALGYLYYLQTEQGLRSLGLADDEYPDNDNFPLVLYVRESRRMVGLSEMNESDVTYARSRKVFDTVAIGDYPMDSHATQELTDPTARHRGEGEWWLVRYTPWYQVPLGVIIPKDIQGLLVPTAVSATHVAYGTLRMEPVRMSLGQAAGNLAALAVRMSTYPHQIPVAILQDRLAAQKVYLTWFEDVNKNTRHFRAIQFMSARGFFTGEQFSPEDPLTREEAKWLVDRLVRVEKHGVEADDPTLPLDGSTPITRAEFAELLVGAKRQIDPSWTPIAVVSTHYADLQPGTATAAFAETLYRHHIDTRTWAGPPSRSEQGLLFNPEAAITRSDAAQALWLAHRAEALRLVPDKGKSYE